MNAKAALFVLLFSASAFAATPDGLVTSKTKLSLWTTAGVRSGAVHVDTTDGVVTLSGKVPTAEQRTLAEKTTRSIMGVRDVTNRLQVVKDADLKQTTRSDNETKASIEKSLAADGALKDSSIRVKSVDKGVVLLSGKAQTLSDHLRAILIADRIAGVARVTTEVTGPDSFGREEQLSAPNQQGRAVRSSSQDLATSTSVKLRLWTAAEVPSTEISVDTNDGFVTLFGMVPTEAVKASAAKEAAKGNGVLHVENLLEVVSSPMKANVEAKDADITRDLVLLMKDKPEYKRVNTSVKNGMVQLTGMVDSGWTELSVTRATRMVPGVRGVDDQLRVDPPND